MKEAERGPRDDRWYFKLMAPNTKGDQFAWLDPTSIYINQAAFHDLLTDLLTDLKDVKFDVVGGLDAMGFVLGASIAARRNVGFLPIRKAGKLCVETDSVSFTNYSGRRQNMEMRSSAFSPGTRVLLVDQWIETGGTMTGAIELVERQKGIVSALVAIAMEATPGANRLREKHHLVTAILPNTKWQDECNSQRLSSFQTYDASKAFPL